MKKFLAIALALLMCIGCFPLVSFAAEATDHLTEVPRGYVGVYTKDDLDDVRLNLSGNYILMNDIVFEEADFEKGGDFYNGGKGWSPIGTGSTEFTGIFDGNGYKIKNLYINSPEQGYIGLFGYLNDATIKNLTLNNADITGCWSTGGVAGFVYGVVSNCNVDGSITSESHYIGGIVGSSFSSSTIANCNFNGSVTGGDYAGGIVGYTVNSITVKDCNVQGKISGNKYVGGIVGNQQAGGHYSSSKYKNYINNCNNAANISAVSYAGGIVGYSESDNYYCSSFIQYCSNSGNVSATESIAGGIAGYSGSTDKSTKSYVNYCYNCGDVSASSYAGGLIGECCSNITIAKHSYSVGTVVAESFSGGCFGTEPSSESFCYYLDEAVVNPTCASGTAKNESQLRSATTFEQWDFTNTWTMSGREDYPYPELIAVPLVMFEDYSEHQHSYSSTVIAPTCVNKGYTMHTCECGEIYVADLIEANGHIAGDWVITKPSTAISTGEKKQSCTVCGEVLATQTIPLSSGKVYGVYVSDVSLDYEASAILNPSIFVDSGVAYTVTYSSSNSDVAYVDENGNVTATGTGTAEITCTVTDEYGNVVTDTCEVEVKYNWWQWIIVIVLFGWIWY